MSSSTPEYKIELSHWIMPQWWQVFRSPEPRYKTTGGYVELLDMDLETAKFALSCMKVNS